MDCDVLWIVPDAKGVTSVPDSKYFDGIPMLRWVTWLNDIPTCHEQGDKMLKAMSGCSIVIIRNSAKVPG